MTSRHGGLTPILLLIITDIITVHVPYKSTWSEVIVSNNLVVQNWRQSSADPHVFSCRCKVNACIYEKFVGIWGSQAASDQMMKLQQEMVWMITDSTPHV